MKRVNRDFIETLLRLETDSLPSSVRGEKIPLRHVEFLPFRPSPKRGILTVHDDPARATVHAGDRGRHDMDPRAAREGKRDALHLLRQD
jgi:hypothetical protein